MNLCTDGVRTRIVEGTTALDGNGKWLHEKGDDSYVIEGISTPYYYGWEYVHKPSTALETQPWENARLSRPAINTRIWDHTALRHRDGIPLGYKMTYRLPNPAGVQVFIGHWKTGNPTTGQVNLNTTFALWDWGIAHSNAETLGSGIVGFTFNTTNADYDAANTYWKDPKVNVGTLISLRYHGDKSFDIFDEDKQLIIATKDADLDGNPVKISWAANGDVDNLSLFWFD